MLGSLRLNLVLGELRNHLTKGKVLRSRVEQKVTVVGCRKGTVGSEEREKEPWERMEE